MHLFKEWNFLIGEMWLLLALAALLGFLFGYLLRMFSKASGASREELQEARVQLSSANASRADLQAKLDACARARMELETYQGDLRQRLSRCQSKLTAAQESLASSGSLLDEERDRAAFVTADTAPSGDVVTLHGATPVEPSAFVSPPPQPDPVAVEPEPVEPSAPSVSFETEEQAPPSVEIAAAEVGDDSKPPTLTEARNGAADDLKRIKGVGVKLEDLLNQLGFYHFDQIAAWTDREVAWVDENLEGFNGRVLRDNWVEQARLLATGEETEFSRRVDDGDIYGGGSS